MDKGSLKVFAIEARRDLMEKVKARLDFLGITSKWIDKRGVNFLSGNVLEIGDNRYKKSSYDDLVKKYESIGYEQLIEESAYIWFNRLVALAYMEANGYIDEKMIFSNGSKIVSGIIDDYYEADFFDNMEEEDQERLHNLRDRHKTEDMYTMLIEEKCNELHKIMPFMFDKKGGYSDILFPAGLFTSNSVLVRLREEFEKAKEKNEEGEDVIPVEIIGWLYQYYNQDKREVIYDGSLKKAKITKDYIAPATQLFTPHWIVKYMAENSLGKLAIENLKVSPELKRNWKYYIDNEIDNNIERLNVEDIKIIDPSMGSGHILTYSFDMLYEIYEDLGWSRKDAVLSILKNNLYGLEIDKRAGQLASFAIMMKGREKFPRLLKVLERLEDEEKFDLNTLWIDESNDISQEMRKLINSNSLKNLEILIDNFTDAKEYGSILKLTSLDIAQAKDELEKLIEIYKRQGQLTLLSTSNQLDFSVVDINFEKECRIIKKLIQQQKIMTDIYDVTITNPPYMGNVRMNDKLKDYINNYYPDVKSDLFAVFFIKCCEMTKEKGHLGFMSPFVWMFIKSYEELRRFFIEEKTITSLVQLEYSSFEDATVPICTFTLQNYLTNKNGEYIRLSDFKGAKNQSIKTLEAIKNSKCNWRYKTNQLNFLKIPSYPIAYWITEKIINIFSNDTLITKAEAKKGLFTGDNNRFLRLFWEVSKNNIFYHCSSKEESFFSNLKWYPILKGGEYRKWYGNREYLLNYQNDGRELKEYKGYGERNPNFYFKMGLSWSKVSSSKFSIRISEKGFLYDDAGPLLFIISNENLKKILAYLNSKIVSLILQIINPTLVFQPGNINILPYLDFKNKELDILVQQNIDIAKEEWDSRETSWDFETLYLAKGNSIESAYNDYCNHWRDNFVTMHKNEEELNKIFIDIYDLNDEMDNFVSFEDITLLKKEAEVEEILIPAQHIADIEEKEKTSEGYLYNRGVKLEFDKLELVKQFLSYAVGCIMGRYSIDKKGLIIANSDDVLEIDKSSIYIKDENGEIRHHIENPRFIPDSYGIIPITSEKVFDNDIVTKVIEFVEALYGKENLEKNLEFICNALGRKGDEKYDTTLRNYFIKDFYTDHLQRYQKRPIYWLMNSGKKNGFSALIYLHRYKKNSVARVRTEYLLPYQDKLENLRAYYERITFDDGASAKEKKQAEKSLKELDAMLKELRDYANEVKHIAELKIDLDLDDGVKVNYEKFGKVLKKI
ncbi:BREX-1 system adenine-specific DNA-methyltransferase PglX [Fusobacterium mortiferum]|uniref:site-specific DNA-methyltransferase (adenine-specific) n=1 Tax=Fusobacterium mortiferum TaxID=850 RepID=A0A414PUA2_FUSMR|nr:BREX-1 system adenine-specific DNA-methyltransferase PglX [Fusobacterium mortiferum]RHF72157.1 BREX-1 system adenine-specific DNA-methyltransferase PglX [Fusobacterium mortiferum]